MRTAVCSALATAVIAGALLAPAAGTAFAVAPAGTAAASGSVSVPDIDEGVVAVLRHKARAPRPGSAPSPRTGSRATTTWAGS
ncbi:hypothetical protein [Streptomyces sp. NPDC006463]|uniref:hypothetical protein n=1 Tax=Streptomyces sp. NPDC006463 TaxID=3364746 RepID=UPI0036AD17B9